MVCCARVGVVDKDCGCDYGKSAMAATAVNCTVKCMVSVGVRVRVRVRVRVGVGVGVMVMVYGHGYGEDIFPHLVVWMRGWGTLSVLGRHQE